MLPGAMPLGVPSFKSNWQTVHSTDSTGEGDENLQSEFASTKTIVQLPVLFIV